MAKRCKYCGQFFVPDRRTGNHQKAWSKAECKKKRKREAQLEWVSTNPEHMKNLYEDYVRPWREKKKAQALAENKTLRDRKAQMIKDERPYSKPLATLVLLIPDDTKSLIKDEIRLRRVDNTTFAAYGS